MLAPPAVMYYVVRKHRNVLRQCTGEVPSAGGRRGMRQLWKMAAVRQRLYRLPPPKKSKRVISTEQRGKTGGIGIGSCGVAGSMETSKPVRQPKVDKNGKKSGKLYKSMGMCIFNRLIINVLAKNAIIFRKNACKLKFV